ncbi:uncharacterized protein LOC143341377 [Colletes latitarsis]|uniref:uncharacterized protein LOC143341377 n=1 Tax=Colletes latitarsis TaxID=2605962 RepID=UPI0040358E9D
MRYSVTVASFSLAVIFITHICGQIQTQIERLKDLIGKKWKNDSRNRNPLDGIIRDHAKTLRFAKNVVAALREICLAQIVESTLSICLLEYYFLKEWQNSDAVAISTYAIYLISFTFNAFIFCYIGEILFEQCSQIGPASYEIDWYTLPPKKATDIILMNAISLYPPKLTGGNIFELSLLTFGTIMQTSVVYLNLLRKFTDWYNVTVAAFSLAVIFVTHICGQIQIQMVRLEDFVGNKNARDMHPHPLNIIIRDHAAILQFAKNVEEALREIFLTQILESTLTICLLEYYCLRDWESSDLISIITYSIFLISFTFNTFIFCYMGELLSEQCSQIGQASYEIDWYTLPPKKASYLILMNAISLYPPKLTGGKIFELSLFTFGTVMKTSVVYLNLLRTVSDW